MTDDVIELENKLNDDGLWTVHLMANTPLGLENLTPYGAPHDVLFESKKEFGVWHLRASWLFCGPLMIHGDGWPQPKTFVVWNLSLAHSVKRAMYEANCVYEKMFSEQANYAFVRQLPRGVENGVEVGNLTLFEAEWMIRKCVAVGFLYA